MIVPLASMHEALHPKALQRKKEGKKNLHRWLQTTRVFCQVQPQCGSQACCPCSWEVKPFHTGQGEFRKAPCEQWKALALKVALLSHLSAMTFWLMNESIVVSVLFNGCLHFWGPGVQILFLMISCSPALTWRHSRSLMAILSFFP